MDGQTVVVTGATDDVGERAALAFAAEGANVAVGGRDADDVERLVAALEDEGVAATGLRTDVRDRYDVERLMETASKLERDGIDVVVPAADVYHGEPGATPLSEESYTAFDDTEMTNARGVFAAIREALPHLTADGRVLVPTASVARSGAPGYGAYAVSRAAAEAVMRGFAADIEQPVGCVELGQTIGESDPSEAGDLLQAAATVDADVLDGTVLTAADLNDA